MALLFWIPQFLIKVALLFTVVMAFVWMAFSFYSGSIIGGIFGVIIFALTVCYAYAVWSRIPFATANLVTACTAIRANLGVAIYAYFFAILAGGWAIVWSLAFVGLFDQTYSCDDVTNVCSDPSYGILFALFLAFFFVQQVIQVCICTGRRVTCLYMQLFFKTLIKSFPFPVYRLQSSIHVTVAGTVGTWCTSSRCFSTDCSHCSDGLSFDPDSVPCRAGKANILSLRLLFFRRVRSGRVGLLLLGCQQQLHSHHDHVVGIDLLW
jgi:hypothetical protein